MSGHLEHKDGNHRRDSVQENLNAACLVTQALGTTYPPKHLNLIRNLLLSAAGAQGVAQNCPPYLHAKWRLLLRTPRSTGRSWGLHEAEDHLFPENTVPHRGGEQGQEAHRQA